MEPDQYLLTEDNTHARVEHEQHEIVMTVPEEMGSTMTHGYSTHREILVIPIKSSHMRVSTAATGYVYTSQPNFKTSAIDIDEVQKYYKTQKDVIVSIREQYEEPGLLAIEIVNGTSIKIEKTSGSVMFDQNIFSCGKCLNVHSFRKYDVKKHVVKCSLQQERKKERRINKNKRQQRWRLKRKIEAASGGRPVPKQQKTSASNLSSKSPVNHSTINFSQNHDEVLEENAPSSSSDSDGEMEYSEKEQRNFDTLINLGPSSEIMHGIFKVKDLNFVRYYCATENTELGAVWRPSKCPLGLVENDTCRISFHGFTTRTRVFGFPLPFFLRHRQLHCENHKKVFTYFSQEMADQLPVGVFPTEDIVVFEKTLMTREFYGDLTMEYEAHFNTTRMHKTIPLKWVDNALTYLDRDARQQLSKYLSESSGEDFTLELPLWDKLKPLRSLTPKLITKIIQTWWNTDKEDHYQSSKFDFIRDSTRLSGDHTYKCVRNIGTYEIVDGKKEWVGVKASLYTIMNQQGHLVDFKICPSDAFVHVGEVLGGIWETQAFHRTATTQFHTDNVAKDRNQILSLFADKFPENVAAPAIVQDLYHAEQRIVRKMNKSSRQFYIAQIDLRSLFSTFKKSPENGGYSTKESVLEAFQNWVYKFMSDTEETELSEEDQLKLVGASLLQNITEEQVMEEEEEEEPASTFVDDTFLKDITEDVLSVLFQTDVFERAQDRVSSINFCTYMCGEEKHVFRCGVVGTNSKVYFTSVTVSPPAEGLQLTERFSSACTCPADTAFCKHVAAALICWKRQPSKWEASDYAVVQPGTYSNGTVTLDTVQAVNNIMKPNVLPHLMVLNTLPDTRGTTLNENFHRFIGAEIGTGLGVRSLQQKEMDIKICHMKFNRRQKTQADLLMSTYENGSGFLQGSYLQSQNPVSYILKPKKIKKLSKEEIKRMGFRTKTDRAIWTSEDIELLKATLKQLYTGEYQILSKNPYYWISHHTFDDCKSEKDVKQFVKRNFMNFHDV